jgi:threonine dehydrogenase-like Zn-dependent dehydrogenase
VRQLTWLGPGALEWQEVDAPRLEGDGEAIVRPIAVATCDLDAVLMSADAPLPPPFAFGHEAVAEVVEVGPGVTVAAPGDRVIVPFQMSCGRCDPCRRGATGSCETAGAGAAYGMAPIGRGEWGGMLSDLARVPYSDAMLVPLPAGLVPADVASVADNVPDGWRAVAPPLAARPGAPVLVVGGAGSVGLYAAAAAVALGSEHVDYLDDDPRRVAIAEAVGAHPIEARPDGRRAGRYPITVDHAGTVEGLHTAIRSTEPEGTCTSTAIYFDSEVPLPMLEMYTRGIRLHTGRVNARAAIPEVLALVVSGRLHPELVTAAEVAWDDATTALVGLDAKVVLVR